MFIRKLPRRQLVGRAAARNHIYRDTVMKITNAAQSLTLKAVSGDPLLSEITHRLKMLHNLGT
jgi:hypothetical protein